MYYFWVSPHDVMHYSGGGHHDIICTEPVQNVTHPSGVGWTEASRITMYKHPCCVKRTMRKSLVNASDDIRFPSRYCKT